MGSLCPSTSATLCRTRTLQPAAEGRQPHASLPDESPCRRSNRPGACRARSGCSDDGLLSSLPAFSGAVIGPMPADPGRPEQTIGEVGNNETMTAADVQEVIDKELSLLTNTVRSNASKVDGLLDASYREIGASGRLWSRASIIDALSETSDEDEQIDASDMAGEALSADLILLTYTTVRGQRRARRSSLWRRSNGTWRLLFHQGTLSDVSTT